MKLGDHVRALVSGEYRHGIDCGDRTVLFLARDPSGRPEVRRALVSEFAVGAMRVETVVHREQVFAPRAVVARAFSRMRDPAAAASFTSSEDFATWCLTGRPPEPSFAPAAKPARPAPRPPSRPGRRPARRAAGKKKAKVRPTRRVARKATPRRRPRKAAPRPAPRRKKASAPRPAPRRKRRR